MGSLLSSMQTTSPRYGVFLLALLVVALLHAVVADTPQWRITFDIAYFLLVVPAIRLLMSYRRLRWLGLGLGLAALLSNVSFLFLAEELVEHARNTMLGTLLFTATAVMFTDVLKPGRISWNKIMGAISVYLLIGYCFAFLFNILAVAQPYAFEAQQALQDLPLDSRRSPYLYYSFVTLTTLGYGDLVPVSSAARTLSWIEAVMGQLYLTILVARLVGLHIAQSAGQARES